jgi:hypothetical protein
MVFYLSDTNIKLVEIGITFFVLAVFIALFVVVSNIARTEPWVNIVYILLILAYAVVMSFVGYKLSPHIN